jgi:hypothetical protein
LIERKAAHGVDAHNLLDCAVSGSEGATVVRPAGVLDIHTYPVLRDCLLKCAADQPRAVVVDLDALEIAHEFLISVFVTVWLRVSQWSVVPLALVPAAGHAALFRDSPTRRFLTLHPSVRAALDLVDEPAARRRTELWLPSSVLSVQASARFVADTCHNWGVEALTADAVAVAGELVAPGARRTESPATLRLELWRGKLTVAVADDDPRPVELQRTAELARASGCSHRHSGGKVVWAVLRVPASS